MNIRGVGLQATNPTTSSGVAIYSDGFFIPHETAIGDDYYDVGQVEILRGPQGTLVGQSSTGGAIFVTSVKPSFDHVTGYAQQSVGNYGYRQTEGAVNVPISDQLAFRLAGTFDNRDSFYNDLNVGGAAITSGLQPGNVDSQSGRIGVDWQPTAALDIYVKYDTTTRKGDGFVAKDYAELAGANNSVDPRLSKPFDISYDEPSWDKYRMSRITAEINWTLNGVVDLEVADGLPARCAIQPVGQRLYLSAALMGVAAVRRDGARAGVRPDLEDARPVQLDRGRVLSSGFHADLSQSDPCTGGRTHQHGPVRAFVRGLRAGHL